MNFSHFLQSCRLHKKIFFILLIVLFSITTAYSLLTQSEKHKTYIFFTVAPHQYTFKEDPVTSINSFYLISASDIFAETIIGWFKNPSFLYSIESHSKITPLPSLSARKETKQNVMIFFTTNTKETAQKTATAIRDTISTFVENYNQSTNTQYSLVNVSTTISPITGNIILEIILSFFVSLLLAFAIIVILPKKKIIKKTTRR